MKPFGPFHTRFAAAQHFSFAFHLERGIEPFAQVLFRGFSPGSPVLFFLTVPFVAPLFFGEADAAAVVVFAAEAGGFTQDALEAFPALVGVGDFVEFLDGGEELDGQQGAEAVGEGHAVVLDEAFLVYFEFLGLLDEGLDLFAGLLEAEPGLIAAGFPLGEVLRRDGAGIEFLFEDRFDLGDSIEPGEDVVGGLAVVEALVELVADVFG